MTVIRVKSAEEAAQAVCDFIKKDIQENCPHEYGFTTKVLSQTATCETTVTICDFCRKQLDEPLTQC